MYCTYSATFTACVSRSYITRNFMNIEEGGIERDGRRGKFRRHSTNGIKKLPRILDNSVESNMRRTVGGWEIKI